MLSPRVDIISIGTLSRNLLWKETTVTRTPHATTSLIRATKKTILVDPGLPASVLNVRLNERAGIRVDAIDAVFLTNFRAAHRGGLSLFANADWFIHENEMNFARAQLESLIEQAPPEDLDRKHLEHELDLLNQCKPADDKLADGVDLFPLFGYTPGTCGLLVSSATLTALITGDAVPTLDHFLAGQVLPDAQDIKAAHESMGEVYEIADVIIPGHDNLFINPRTMGA